MMDHALVTSLLQPSPSRPSPKPIDQPGKDVLIKLKTMEAHFGKEGYEVVVSEGSEEKSGLEPREMMFLVRFVLQLVDSLKRDGLDSREKRSSGECCRPPSFRVKALMGSQLPYGFASSFPGYRRSMT